MWVCLCFKLNESDIEALIEEQGIDTIIDNSKKKGCGSCAKTILESQNSKLQKEKD